VLDCTGRTGVLARNGFRRRDGAPATTALVGIWHSASGWRLSDESHTVIESYEDGWAWSVPVAPGTRYIAAMIDPRRTRLARAGSMNALYRAEIRKTQHMSRLLYGAVPRIPPWACSAATYDAARYAVPGALLVGDAGSFLDPLSSAGVKKALASAHLAAVAVHTCLQRPSMTDAALALFEQRERTAHAHYSGLAARYYAEAAAHYAQPFWLARATATAGFDAVTDEVAIEGDPRVREAFYVLRADARARLRPASGVGRVQRPTVIGHEVVLAEHLVSPAARAGVRVFRGVDLPALVAVAEEHDEVADLFEAYGRIRPAVNLPDFVGAVSALVALGMLERTGAAPATTEKP
jgi:Tryptophan halogenase